MKVSCDDVPHGRSPLGTVFPCGCIVRAVLSRCTACGYERWGATGTDVPPGGNVLMQGFCESCGTPMNQLVPVYEQPIPDAFHRA